MEEKLIKIRLLNKNKYFRLCSITRANDGSIYFHFPINSNLKRNGAKKATPVKYSYHPTGKMCRITGGNEHERAFEFKPKELPTINLIKDPVGLCRMSFCNLKNDIGNFLDDLGSIDYKNIITVSDENYSDLTIRFFLCSNDFVVPLSREYRETYVYSLNNIKILITLQDLWEGK